MHIAFETALRSALQFEEEEIAVIMLRLTFGGKACPSEWGAASEILCDLTNALLNDPSWDPEELYNPQSDDLPEPASPMEGVELGQARELAIEVPVSDVGSTDVYIDDLFGFAADLPGTDNVRRLERACLLILHALARPKHPNEPIPRHPMASEDKFKAEAGATELKMVLGWLCDYRRLIVSLPHNKFVAWTNELQAIIDSKKAEAKQLEQNIGRLIHVAQILPEIYHFLNRLRCLFERAKKRGKPIAVKDDCLADCRLLQLYIQRAHEGISMNSLVPQKPSIVYRSDSCPHGLGGYSSNGRAWRWYVPEELLYRATNNLLEHIASIITVWIDVIEGTLQPEDCILSMTDSSTSEGWHKKTNFKTDPVEADCDFDPEEAEVRTEICRQFAEICVKNKLVHHVQWFAGKQNDVSDALSRDDDRSDEELTHLLYSHCPEQMPQHFEIAPLPQEILSWVTSLLQRLCVKEQLREKRSRTEIGRSDGGSPMPNPSVSPTTFGSTTSTEPTASKSSAHSQLPFDKAAFLDRLMTPWLNRLSEVPYHTLHRPLGLTTSQTQQETMMESLEYFYQGYTEALETKIQLRNSRKLSQQESC